MGEHEKSPPTSIDEAGQEFEARLKQHHFQDRPESVDELEAEAAA